MSSTSLAALALLCAPGLHAGSSLDPLPGPDERVERRVAVMGTWLTLEIYAADRPTALGASERALRAVESVEGRLSTWREDSPLGRLNRSPVGTPVEVDPDLALDLARAAELCERTRGAFDPGLGALVEAWGLRTGGHRPPLERVSELVTHGGLRAFTFGDGWVRRDHAAAVFEEGGFGKGRGLEAALEALGAEGIERASLDLGGQLAFLGSTQERHGLAHPDHRERPVLEVELRGGSLATSGNGERGIVVDGERLGHLLDPRTGQPAPDFGSLTVWCPAAMDADALSTGLYVLGPEGALDFARDHDDVGVIALVRTDEHLEAWASEDWRGRLRPLDPNLTLRFPAASGQPDKTQTNR